MVSRVVFEEKCYAKVNLFLYNLGKREDGFHELYTLFYPIKIYDTIILQRSNITSITCNNPYIPTNSNNIIFAVDKILRENYDLEDTFKVHIRKRIPLGAGLGGGSSNAAAYLRIINRISNLRLSEQDMCNIMQKVGSDTAFFLKSKPALGRGRGEILSSVYVPDLFITIVNPGFSISTKNVFSSKNLELTILDNSNMIGNSVSFQKLLPLMKNDLETAVVDKNPKISEIKDTFYGTGAVRALMSGSGPTVFGIYKDFETQKYSYYELKRKYPQYVVEIV